MQQTPSVGRIVHYIHSGAVCAAIVTHVWSDTMINCAPFDANGNALPGVTSSSYNEDRITHGTWSWPPFVPGK